MDTDPHYRYLLALALRSGPTYNRVCTYLNDRDMWGADDGEPGGGAHQELLQDGPEPVHHALQHL